MHIETKEHGEVALVSLEGRFDASVADSFKAAINGLLAQGSQHYVINFADVAYIDSAGLGSLVASTRRVRENNGDIKIAELSAKLRSIFNLTRLNRLFEVYDERLVAVSSFAQVSSEV